MTSALLLVLLSAGVGPGEDALDTETFGEYVDLGISAPQVRRGTTRSRRSSPAWEYFSLGPYKGPRHNVWHSLFNTPPLEEALVLPKGMSNIRMMLDINSADWSAQSPGGTSQYHAVYVSESVEFNYGLSDQLLVGARLTMGELGESDDDIIRVYEGNSQIIPTGERSFGFSDLVLRGKYAGTLGWADFGLLGEFKIPIADEDDYLTAQTLDLGVSAILSKRWRKFALHLNLGFVMPLSDPDLFLEEDDAALYFHGGIAAGYRIAETLTGLLQVQFNTNAFDGASEVESNVTSALIGGRFKFSDTTFFSGTLGTGLGEDSGDLSLSGAIDFVF